MNLSTDWKVAVLHPIPSANYMYLSPQTLGVGVGGEQRKRWDEMAENSIRRTKTGRATVAKAMGREQGMGQRDLDTGRPMGEAIW